MIDDCQDMPTHPRRIRMCREIHAPDEISGYFPGTAVLDPTAKHLDLVGAAAQQVANIALADRLAARGSEAPIEVGRDQAAPRFGHERLEPDDFFRHP